MTTTLTAPAPPAFDHADDTDIFARVIPFTYERHYWGEHRTESLAEIDVAADRLTKEEQAQAKALMSLTKRLIESPEIDAIRLVDRRFAAFMRKVATPFKPTEYLVPVALIETVRANAKLWLESRARLADEAAEMFPQRVEEMAAKDPLHDPDVYPSKEDFRAKFTARYRFQDFGVPELLRALSENAFAEERQKMAELGREASERIEQHLAGTLLSILTHFKDLLSPKANGRRPSLREGALTPLMEFLSLAPMRNVTGSAAMQSIVDQLNQLQTGLTVEDLRDDQFRSVIALRVEEIAASVNDLVSDETRRGIRLRK